MGTTHIAAGVQQYTQQASVTWTRCSSQLLFLMHDRHADMHWWSSGNGPPRLLVGLCCAHQLRLHDRIQRALVRQSADSTGRWSGGQRSQEARHKVATDKWPVRMQWRSTDDYGHSGSSAETTTTTTNPSTIASHQTSSHHLRL